jgi:hypothetical protein
MTDLRQRRTVQVPAVRLVRWVQGFEARHGTATVQASPDVLVLTGADGATAELAVPFPPWPAAEGTAAPCAERLVEHVLAVRRVLVVLVRRGGYGCAVVEGAKVVSSKVGRGQVHGRTAAGGWSQQRYARRRENQTDHLVRRVAEVAAGLVEGAGCTALVTGGDRALVERVLGDPRLSPMAVLPQGVFLDAVEPKAAMVRDLPGLVTQVRVSVVEITPGC